MLIERMLGVSVTLEGGEKKANHLLTSLVDPSLHCHITDLLLSF